MKNKTGRRVVMVVAALLVAAAFYYVSLPAINIHSQGLWMFILVLSLIPTGISFIKSVEQSPVIGANSSHLEIAKYKLKDNHFKLFAFISGGIFLIYIIGSLLSSEIVNANAYQQLTTPVSRDFTEDIQEISYEEIPLLDKDSARLLGSRKMGSMVEYVSQFEVSDENYQINYQGMPYRVAPLLYGNFFKWISNQKDGIPAYIMVNMANQSVECIKLPEGMRYSTSEHFGRYIHRYLRFHYPTYMFEDVHFEVDDNGTPFWVCPVKTYSIGLFGGTTISRVVLCNAVTGELTNYKTEDVPTWVDRVYPAELLISYYDYYGTLKHGWLNTLFSAKDCLQTTDGYNYIALDDDVWVYTGITSVGADESNVGFVLMNQRTAETRYYEIPGAEEFSAMASAEGQVQHLNYISTFPLLLNISGEPTYFMSLKDDAGLVKKYAMVNIGKYNIVAIGDSVKECENSYITLLQGSGIMAAPVIEETVGDEVISGTIRLMYPVAENGYTRFYITLNESDELFMADPSSLLSIVRYGVGDTVSFEYAAGEKFNTVTAITE